MDISALSRFPGGDLVLRGLRDLEHDERSAEAWLVLVGAPRLRLLGLKVPGGFDGLPEHELYLLLAEAHGDAAHSKYNALIRRLVSFERAAECAA